MKRMWCSLILAAAGLLSIPAAAGAAEYDTFVGCSAAGDPIPAHDCQLGDSPGAFFEADEPTEYEVCVEFPDAEFLCAEEQFAEEGVLYVNQITSSTPGEHFVWWYVEEDLVGFWNFRLNAPAPPPPPPALPAPPAVVPPVVITPQVSVACLKAKSKVRKFKGQLRKAVLPKAKTRIRGKLNRARAAAKRHC